MWEQNSGEDITGGGGVMVAKMIVHGGEGEHRKGRQRYLGASTSLIFGGDGKSGLCEWKKQLCTRAGIYSDNIVFVVFRKTLTASGRTAGITCFSSTRSRGRLARGADAAHRLLPPPEQGSRRRSQTTSSP